MTTPPVTVIIPTYNRSELVLRSIQSVVEQSYPHVVLIVVDDGSTDDTRRQVTHLARQSRLPIQYMYQENQGAASARNTGVKAVRSGLICFLDSDDCFLPDKISTQVKGMLQSGRKISHTREIWYRRGHHLNQKKKHQPPDGSIFSKCLEMCVVGMSTVMVDPVIFDRYGWFDESLPCCEDYDYWLRVSAGELFHLVDTPLTVKDGGRDDQLSVIYRMGMDKFRIQSIVNILEQDRLTDRQYALAVHELERKCRIYGNGCLKHGKEEEGGYYLQLPARYITASMSSKPSGP